MAAAEPGLPLRLRGPPDRSEGEVRPVGDRGRARGDEEGAARLPRRGGARGRRADRRARGGDAHGEADRGAGARPKPTGGADPDYGSCKEARAHGAGPYRRGVDREYEYYRDVDGDGIVCE
ncbi:excalibur calcium-binding domain-containing protein [Nannocystis pusilla]|uniref:excalibur calcium-binding domain-containing protein n=1 Tax=Nannocystis pusilla TaxID=889268 RepID=UPI003B7D1C13